MSRKPTAKPADVSGISPGGTGPGSRPLPPGRAAGFEAVVLSPRPTLSLPFTETTAAAARLAPPPSTYHVCPRHSCPAPQPGRGASISPLGQPAAPSG